MGWNFFYFIFNDTFFDIKDIHISGYHYLNEDMILSQGNFEQYKNIFNFNKKAVKTTLLDHPWIKDAAIKKLYPDQLKITIVERKPEIILNHLDHFYLVSEDGIVLSRLNEIDKDFDLFLVSGLKEDFQLQGDRINSAEYNAVREIIYALENIFPDQFYKIKVVDAEEFLLFHKKEQIKVRIRGAEQLINEWYLLEKAMQRIITENIVLEEINMKYKERLSIILKN